jgi:glycerol-3-phosphate dehydrogenase
MGPAWTASGPLPGGDMPNANFDAYTQQFRLDYPWLPEAEARHYLRLYGTLAREILADAQSLNDLGIYFGSTLYECELRYLIEQEWAQSLDDILWRRTKYGLHLNAEQQQILAEWLQSGNTILG